MDKILEKWDEILSTVKHEHDISDISFDTWIRPLEVYGVEGSTLYILVPSEQMTLSYISKKYYLPLKVTIAELTGTEYEIKFILPEQTKNIRTGNSGVPKCTFRKGGQIKSESELYIRHVRRRQQ